MAKLTDPSGVHIRPFMEFDEGVDWVAPQTDPGERQVYRNWLEQNSAG